MRDHYFGLKTRVQKGFTIVEVMVAMVVSLILLAGVLQVFMGSKQFYSSNDALSRLQENGRFAMEFLARDIRMADFWGCSQISDVTNLLNAGAPDFTSGGIEGADGGAHASGGQIPDTITIRGAFGSGLTVQPDGTNHYGPLPSSEIRIPEGNDIEEGEIVLVSDCESGDIFQVTNANPSGSGQAVHNTGEETPGNSTHELSKVYEGDAQLYKLREIQYLIQDNPAGQPALYRSIDGANPVELVEGIENMQILYGEDTNGDRSADYYVALGDINDIENVVSVRITLTVRTLADFIAIDDQNHNWNGTTDRRVRQEFTSTITIRNRVS